MTATIERLPVRRRKGRAVIMDKARDRSVDFPDSRTVESQFPHAGIIIALSFRIAEADHDSPRIAGSETLA
jgi:hypothetical protein